MESSYKRFHFSSEVLTKVLVFLFLASCQSGPKLKDVPIIKKGYFQGELFCIYEVKFLTGDDRCIPEEEFKTEIEPYSVILPKETYEFFKETALFACLYANKEKKNQCSDDIKSIDEWIRKLYDITKSFKQ